MRRLKIIATITYSLLAIIVYYFFSFDRLLTKGFDNILIFMIIFILIYILLYGIFSIRKKSDIYYVIPQLLILNFLVRAIPNIQMSYPPFHDPYYYFIGTLNIMEYGTLRPVYEWWYSSTDGLLHWPIIQLLTTVLAKIANIDGIQLLRFQEPLLGTLFFISTYTLSKTISRDEKIAMISASLASLNGIIIFYQSEYHPQGFEFIILVLILICYMKEKVEFRIMTIIFIIVFILTHHFSSLFIALLFTIISFLIILSEKLKFNIINMMSILKTDIKYYMVIIITGISYHIYYWDFAVQFFDMARKDPLSAKLPQSFKFANIPLLRSVHSLIEWVILVLAIITILRIIKRNFKNKNEIFLANIFVLTFLVGAFGNFVGNFPLDRIVAFCIPIESIFATLTLYRFKETNFIQSESKRTFILSIIISILIISGIFNSQIPAFFFKNSEMNSYYWYSNKIPKMDESKAMGEWIGKNTKNNSIYGTEFDTRILPFFYGRRPNIDVYYYQTASILELDKIKADYMLLNPNIPYVNIENNTGLDIMKTIYNNGEFNVYKN